MKGAGLLLVTLRGLTGSPERQPVCWEQVAQLSLALKGRQSSVIILIGYCNLFPKHLHIQYLILMVSVVLWVRVEGGIDIPILHLRKLSLSM